MEVLVQSSQALQLQGSRCWNHASLPNEVDVCPGLHFLWQQFKQISSTNSTRNVKIVSLSFQADDGIAIRHYKSGLEFTSIVDIDCRSWPLTEGFGFKRLSSVLDVLAADSIRWESQVGELQARALRASSPEASLREGHWVKLICGASFEDVAEVQNLSLLYTLAGVDCIDCAADPAVVAAVVKGVYLANDVLKRVSSREKPLFRRPWIMISINDDVDPHFRKAEFNSKYCPSNCPRPCEAICPALAIKFQHTSSGGGMKPMPLDGGVITERCYGCGRCLPVCPMGLINARTYVRPIEEVVNLIHSTEVDAIEIHTGPGHLEAFKGLIAQLGSSLSLLKLVAVSVPDLEEAMIPAMGTMYGHMEPFLKGPNLWQLDGRPMSGDIGAGATRAAVNLAANVAASTDRPPGYLQLAGGTNAHTVSAMEKMGLCGPSAFMENGGFEAMTRPARLAQTVKHETGDALIAGVAYGGYARKVVSKFLQQMYGEEQAGDLHTSQLSSSQLEHYPSLLMRAIQEAIALVDTVKNEKNCRVYQ